MDLLYNIYVLPVLHFHSQLWYDRSEWQTGSCSAIHIYVHPILPCLLHTFVIWLVILLLLLRF